jgi:D-tagatose-1,6-bisphosphate aldolase subunit GatZ/KbaZ
MSPEPDHPLRRIIERHKSGAPIGFPSVCSAHPQVLRAAMLQALEDDSPLLVEATCNQVNQFGGYTGATPDQFLREVRMLAAETGLPPERMILGGDHLGPSPWRGEAPETAMAKARDLVRGFVEAGFTKIHLDASMSCAGDPTPLPDEWVAERSAQLCRTAEDAWTSTRPGRTAPVYVIGSEVPTPGGALEELDRPRVTEPDGMELTLLNARRAFRSRGLESAWERVVAIVVQPGVEFGSDDVADYSRPAAARLSKAIDPHDGLVYEAHSTDYQTESALREMVEDHFCILKVGPSLTFALREAVFALAAIERELSAVRPTGSASRIEEMLESEMLREPSHWRDHYIGGESAAAFERRFGFSDRIRYYWPRRAVAEALDRLYSNLSSRPLPLPLISQFLPDQFRKLREGSLAGTPQELARDKVRDVLRVYGRACGWSR